MPGLETHKVGQPPLRPSKACKGGCRHADVQAFGIRTPEAHKPEGAPRLSQSKINPLGRTGLDKA